MITASKARISRIGPAAGSKLVRIANSTPAMAVKIIAMPSATRIELAIVDAHQLGGVGIVGRGAEGAAETRAVEQKLQTSRSPATATANTSSG